MEPTQVIALALSQIAESIRAYLQGNRAEIDKLESAIEDIDRELVPMMSRESPERLLEYLTRKIELTLKLEDLKVRKGVSISTLFKGWVPVLAPLIAAFMAFIGVLIGAQLQKDSSIEGVARDAVRRETELQPVSYDFALISESYSTNKHHRVCYDNSPPSSSSISSRQ